ncbi:MAG: SRPBCC domain-containing protein [bacterium]|nr:SRPBCC domain-containing protein [bacterium]
MRVSPLPIAPILKQRCVPLVSHDAFELFTACMGEWWPLATHSIGGTHVTGVRFEACVGGRVLEVHGDGAEHVWADVIAWDPPERFVLAWHPNLTPEAASILEVRFREVADGTVVNLEHRGWEEFGAQVGGVLRAGYDPGWDVVLAPFTDAAGDDRHPQSPAPA